MKLRLWPRRSRVEPAPADITPEEPAAPPEPEPEPEPEPAAELELPPAPAPPPEEELPATVTLTLEEAKEAIRAASGDVIQVGFLAGAYRRSQEEDPRSAETRAARAQLTELLAKRLKDRKLLAPDGIFELRDESAG
jgi:hypothetical protein